MTSFGCAHLLHQTLVESLGRIDAAVFEEMVHRDHFRDDRDVLARIERNANLRQLDFENRRHFGVEPGAIDLRVVIPFFELHHDLDALLLAHRANAEDRRNVDEADAANFHVMPLQLVTAADQQVAAAPARDDEIVGDEAMSALHEIEHALRFADAALADEQQADAEDVGERAMKIRRRREFLLEPRLDARVELVRLEPRRDDRNAGGRRELTRSSPGICPFVMNTHGIGYEKNAVRCLRRISASIDRRYVISVSPSTWRRRAGNRST